MNVVEAAESATTQSPPVAHMNPKNEHSESAEGHQGHYMIDARNITKIYESAQNGPKSDGAPKAAVDDVSFQVKQGEMFVIMGLSGSGKSTLLRMLNRLIEPTAGSLTVSGKDAFNLSSNDLRRYRNATVNMVFQHFAIFPHRTVVENVAYGLKVRGVDKAKRRAVAMEALRTVGLDEWADHYPSSLSGGMRQRVGLARGIVTDADVILMDEPFSALDPLIRADMQEFLVKLHRDLKKTVVFVTHDLNEAMKLGDRVMIMKEGRAVQTGSVDDLLNNPADDYVATFTSDVDRSRIITAADIAVPLTYAAQLHDPLDKIVSDMRRHGLDRCYVLTEQRGVVGTTALQELEEAMTDGQTTLTEVQVSLSDHSEADTDTLLKELFGRIDAHEVPLAVLGTNRHLVGVLPRHEFLHALTGPQNEVENA